MSPTIPDEVITWWETCLRLGHIPQFSKMLCGKWPKAAPLWAVQNIIIGILQDPDVKARIIGKWLRELLPKYSVCIRMTSIFPDARKRRFVWLRFPKHSECLDHFNKKFAVGARYSVKYKKPCLYISRDRNGIVRIFADEMKSDAYGEEWVRPKNRIQGGMIAGGIEKIVESILPPGAAVQLEVINWFFLDDEIKKKHLQYQDDMGQEKWY